MHVLSRLFVTSPNIQFKCCVQKTLSPSIFMYACINTDTHYFLAVSFCSSCEYIYMRKALLYIHAWKIRVLKRTTYALGHCVFELLHKNIYNHTEGMDYTHDSWMGRNGPRLFWASVFLSFCIHICTIMENIHMTHAWKETDHFCFGPLDLRASVVNPPHLVPDALWREAPADFH
jgi:hypothetical protein